MPSFVKILCGVVLLVCAVFSTAAQSEVNFSGTWVLNRAKSDIPQFRNLEEGKTASLTMTVAQQDRTLRVTRHFKIDGEEQKETHTYKTDGTETTNNGLRGESVVTKAHWEGKALVVESTRKVSMLVTDVSVESRGVWRLSPDGKTLTIDGVIRGPRGEQRMQAVFDKQ
jgi:hypothetical protein